MFIRQPIGKRGRHELTPRDSRGTSGGNFVSSSKDRIERAKDDRQAGRFGPVPAETEFIRCRQQRRRRYVIPRLASCFCVVS